MKIRMNTLCLIFFMMGVFFVTGSSLSAADENGQISGRVFETGGYELPGAQVQIKGTSITTSADVNGRYKLARVPAGPQVLVVTFMGLGSAEFELVVDGGETVLKDLVLSVAVVEKVSVTGEPLFEGQAKALNQQKNALSIQNIISSDLIGSFPDANSAEATQRIPGVSVQRDQGEGRYVLIRGTEARLNSMMLNGNRLPSPEGDVRGVALDVIPSDLLAAIEVSKAVTPDMDADAIGGAVNLVTKSAPRQSRLNLTLGGGYNQISEKTLQTANFSYGRRFDDERYGVIFGGSYLNNDMGSDNFEVEYDDGNLSNFETRDYTINRKRYGFSATFDGKPAANTEFKLQGMFNQFDDQEYRRRTRYRLDKGAMEREMKDRFETQQIYSFKGDLKHLFAGGLQMSAALSYSYAHEDEPHRRDTTFVQKKIKFSPNLGPDSIDPDNIQPNPSGEDIAKYKFDELVVEDNFTSDRDLVGQLDFELPLGGSSSFNSFINAGFKFKHKTKERDQEAQVYGADDDLFLSAYLDRDYDAGEFLGGRYLPGQFMTVDTSDKLLASGLLSSEKDMEGDLGDYRAKETVMSGYIMGKLYFGERLTLMPGLRYERTQIDYTGKALVYNEDGDLGGIREINGDHAAGLLLPGLHVLYRPQQNLNVRLAFTRTLARPNYYDLVPYQLVREDEREITKGNSALEPTKSWNVDLMVESYFSSAGLISAGVFYKNLEDYIYNFRLTESRPDGRYDVFQPRNGESATLWGFECALQSRLSFLPAPLDGIGLLINYTYTDSKALYPDREGEDSTLPGQSAHLLNLGLSFEKGGFTAKVSLNLHGKYVDAVGEKAENDVYYDNRRHLDLGAEYRISEGFRVFFDVTNLLDDPMRYYIGSVNRPLVEEYYRLRAQLGLRLSL